jgi:hypothetical protein
MRNSTAGRISLTNEYFISRILSPHGADKDPGAVYITFHANERDITALNLEMSISRQLHCSKGSPSKTRCSLRVKQPVTCSRWGYVYKLCNYSETLRVLFIFWTTLRFRTIIDVNAGEASHRSVQLNRRLSISFKLYKHAAQKYLQEGSK